MRIIIGNNELGVLLVTPAPAFDTQIHEFVAYRKVDNLPWPEKTFAFVVGRIATLWKLILFGQVNVKVGTVFIFNALFDLLDIEVIKQPLGQKEFE